MPGVGPAPDSEQPFKTGLTTSNLFEALSFVDSLAAPSTQLNCSLSLSSFAIVEYAVASCTRFQERGWTSGITEDLQPHAPCCNEQRRVCSDVNVCYAKLYAECNAKHYAMRNLFLSRARGQLRDSHSRSRTGLTRTTQLDLATQAGPGCTAE